jgi:hypothetical protein
MSIEVRYGFRIDGDTVVSLENDAEAAAKTLMALHDATEYSHGELIYDDSARYYTLRYQPKDCDWQCNMYMYVYTLLKIGDKLHEVPEWAWSE